MELDLSKYKLDSYKGIKRDSLYDIPRGKYLILTPEEGVRQKFILYMIDKLKIPPQIIYTEVNLKHYKKNSRKRTDIVVFYDIDKLKALLLVECKAPIIPICTDNVKEQLLDYNDVFKANFLIITNGSKIEVYHLKEGIPCLLKRVPTFNEMLKVANIVYDKQQKDTLNRPVFANNYSKKIINYFVDKAIAGEDSSNEIKSFAVNLGGLIFDNNISFESISINRLDKVYDGGNRYAQLGNASGNIGAEQFRRLIVKDKDSTCSFLNLSIQSRWSTKGFFTYLVVAADYNFKTFNSLQLCLDKYSFTSNGSRIIWHDGHISYGSGGSLKKDFVLSEIRKNYPELIQQINGKDAILLGSINCNNECNWIDSDTQQLVVNLVKYVIVRERLKRTSKSVSQLQTTVAKIKVE